MAVPVQDPLQAGRCQTCENSVMPATEAKPSGGTDDHVVGRTGRDFGPRGIVEDANRRRIVRIDRVRQDAKVPRRHDTGQTHLRPKGRLDAAPDEGSAPATACKAAAAAAAGSRSGRARPSVATAADRLRP